jgi:hypothetical protein
VTFFEALQIGGKIRRPKWDPDCTIAVKEQQVISWDFIYRGQKYDTREFMLYLEDLQATDWVQKTEVNYETNN